MRRQLLLTLLSLFISQTAISASVQLAKTGQTACYDSAGNTVICAGNGQDGETRIGAAWPSPRFVDNNNGTLTDNLTGLVWLKNANCAVTLGGVAKVGSLNWSNALLWTQNLSNGSCGLSDGSVTGAWRLPNDVELESLIDYGSISSGMNSRGFVNVQSFAGYYFYWTSTSDAPYPPGAWVVNFATGESFVAEKTSTGYVLPVRPGY